MTTTDLSRRPTVDEDHHFCSLQGFSRIAMPYAAATRTHVRLFRAGLLEVASLWPHPRHLVATRLALGSIASRIAAVTVSVSPVGLTHGAFGRGYSGRGASRVLTRAHRPPRGSASAFSTTPAREGHGPRATQVRSPVLTTLTLSLGTATRRRCGRPTTTNDHQRPTTDRLMTRRRRPTSDDDGRSDD